MNNIWNETIIEQKVTYTLEYNGKLIVVENVPARVCLETGERFFSPETAECLQEIVWENRSPSRTMEASMFEFAA